MPRKKKHWRAKFNKSTPRAAEPGTLIADESAPKPTIRVFAYSNEHLIERHILRAEEISAVLGKYAVTWVDVVGLGDVKTIAAIGDLFGLHRLAQEDVLNVHQRAKLEEYGDILYLVTHQAHCNPLEIEQISLFLGNQFVLTFQEREGDSLDPVRERLRSQVGRLRESGPDYLLYSILDAVVDGYFPVLEDCGEKLELIEDEVVLEPDRKVVGKIHHLKRDLLLIRKTIWPMRDALNSLLHHSRVEFAAETQLHLRDCQDHVIRLIDLIETYRELAADLLDIYLSSLSNRMNEVMKLMALVTTIFVPPTFVASLYGMNYAEDANPMHITVLKWYFSFPFVVLIVAATFVLTVLFVWLMGVTPISLKRLRGQNLD